MQVEYPYILYMLLAPNYLRIMDFHSVSCKKKYI